MNEISKLMIMLKKVVFSEYELLDDNEWWFVSYWCYWMDRWYKQRL